jgi:hypothetical protein
MPYSDIAFRPIKQKYGERKHSWEQLPDGFCKMGPATWSKQQPESEELYIAEFRFYANLEQELYELDIRELFCIIEEHHQKWWD